MRLSTKGEYASRTMLELAVRHGGPALHIAEISRAQGIPARFLGQILLQLKRAGYLRSRKGPNGGYTLARPPKEISVAEVIRVMDGPLAPIDCVSVTARERCPRERTCGLKSLWKETRDAVTGILEGTTFADLAGRTGPAPRAKAPGRRKAGRR
ncbi:MAG: Rrf2 family transcriptional regulator [Candidatus Aminicenantes bacterium]|nr:Rrf2 family transcriptional regulator [Candidatus Aminicenantes bacterium]